MTELTITFTYDHASGLFFARLENGARFAVRRQDLSGKLENALTLFRRGVVAAESGKYVQKPRGSSDLTYSYDESQVQRCGIIQELDLPEISLEDLEL